VLQRVAVCRNMLQLCCSALQRVAVRCSVLQSVAVVLQCVAACCSWVAVRCVMIQASLSATHCITQQHTATHSNTQQHTATHCNTLQHTATKRISTCNSTITFWTSWISLNKLSSLATKECNTMRYTAQHCTTLHHTAPHCNTLQHTATRCNTAIVYLQRRHRFLSLLNLPQHVQPHSHVTPHPPSPPVITQVLTLFQRDDKIVLVERGKAVSCSSLH